MTATVYTIVSLALVAPFACVTSVFAIEVLFGLAPGAPRPRLPGAPDVVVVIPANDEARVIEHTIGNLLAQLPQGFRLLVIADNCTDGTAELARVAGSAVIERRDDARRGKGFALAFARDHLRQKPPTTVVILDADCRIDRQSLERLAGAATATSRPAQAINLLAPDLSASPMVQVSNFAFLIKNLFRQRGLARLAGRVHLTGTGMALPWHLFDGAKLATDDIVEDLSLGLDFAEMGHFPCFVEDATVWSNASSVEGTRKQRARWEGGFLANSLRRGLPDAWAACRHFNLSDLWAALSLLVPPVALLGMIDVTVIGAAGVLIEAGASPVALLIMLAATILALLATALAWMLGGRPYLSVAAAVRVPAYMIWKIPLYFGLLRKRPKAWIRTGR